MASSRACSFFFFFNDTATTEIYTLSLHDALPIYRLRERVVERVEEHEGGDDPSRLGGIEPGGCERDMHGPRELALGSGRRDRGSDQSQEQHDDRNQRRADDRATRQPFGHAHPPLHREHSASEAEERRTEPEVPPIMRS